MKNSTKTLLVVVMVALLTFSCVLVGCDSGGETTPTGEKINHTVTVSDEEGKGLANVGVYVYTDSSMAELVWFAKTDADGKMTFTDVQSDKYVAVLKDVPAGYGVEAHYPLTGTDTVISLQIGMLTDQLLSQVVFGLGDRMMDFTITDCQGNSYQLSQLLTTKKAVVLNFWYENCAPCRMEFPFMQEAYEEYKDIIEILAINPVDGNDESILKFKTDNALNFPMIKGHNDWEKAMALQAYPTTVVIDSTGRIAMIHTGSVDKTQTFRDIFAFFTKEDYEHTQIRNLEDVPQSAVEGSAENPQQIGGASDMEIVLAPGEEKHLELFKVNDMYLQCKTEGIYIICDGKTYTTDDGKISFLLKPQDNYTPVKIVVGNSSNEQKTAGLNFVLRSGIFSNPYSLKMGEFDVKVSSGNEQGVYYSYRATADGYITLTCLSATSGIDYDFSLYNLSTYALRNAKGEGDTDPESGKLRLTVPMKKGQKIVLCVSTLPDSSFNYPAGNFTFRASFDNGEIEEEEKIELPYTTYTVTVTDETDAPVSGVSVNIKGSFTFIPEGEAEDSEKNVPVNADVNLVTDEKGLASTEQVSGPYVATIRIPEGYTLEKSQYELSAENPSVTIKLKKIVMKDYTVTVKTPDGEPVPGVIVIVGNGVGNTDENGTATMNLAESDYSVLLIGIPEDFVLTEDAYAFPEGAAELTITLGYGPGAESNPIVLRDQISATTGMISPGELEHYKVFGVAGSALVIEDADVYVIINDGEPVYANAGTQRIYLNLPEYEEPLNLKIGNNGAAEESYTLKFEFPVGTRQNPEVINSIVRPNITVDAADADGKYLSWTSPKSGELTVSFRSGSAKNCVVTVGEGESSAQLIDGQATSVTVSFEKNVPVLIHVIATQDPDGTYPGISVRLSGSPKYAEEPVGTTYTVTVTDEDNAPQAGVLVQLMKDGAPVGEAFATNGSGVAEVVLEAGNYTVIFVDENIVYDSELAVLTEAAPSVTIPISWKELPVEEGKTRYSVTVMDFQGNMIPNVIVLFNKDGATCGYAMTGSNGGTVTADLATGDYSVQLAFQGSTKYYYEEKTALLSESKSELIINVTADLPGTAETHWMLGTTRPVKAGGTYVTMQSDIINYFTFLPTEQGVYRFTTSDPDAIISCWGDVNYPGDVSSELEDFADNAYTRSVNTSALGQNHVIGITGDSNCIIIITRVGDAAENVPYEEYVPVTPPEELYPDIHVDPDDPESEVTEKKTFVFAEEGPLTMVDLTGKTEDYVLVFNEEDGYFHLRSADGPIMYVQLTFNRQNVDNPVEPKYIHLYKMVGGVDNTGTALRCILKDAEGNELSREDYTACMLSYGDNADPTYGIYPLTQDLKYMIQMGGTHQGWWDIEDKNHNLLFKDTEGNLDTSINLEIAWMFACCYVETEETTDPSNPLEQSLESLNFLVPKEEDLLV